MHAKAQLVVSSGGPRSHGEGHPEAVPASSGDRADAVRAASATLGPASSGAPGPRPVSGVDMPHAPMHMEWVLKGPGSVRFTWEVGETRIQIGTTYLADGLDSVLGMAVDLSLGAGATFATLVAEPGGHRIFCSGASDMVFIQVVQFEDLGSPGTWWKDADLQWHGRVPVADVVDSVQAMTAEVLERHGVEAYAKEWGMPFPTKMYEKLQRTGKPGLH